MFPLYTPGITWCLNTLCTFKCSSHSSSLVGRVHRRPQYGHCLGFGITIVSRLLEQPEYILYSVNYTRDTFDVLIHAGQHLVPQQPVDLQVLHPVFFVEAEILSTEWTRRPYLVCWHHFRLPGNINTLSTNNELIDLCYKLFAKLI